MMADRLYRPGHHRSGSHGPETLHRPSEALPLLDQLLTVASDHEGNFVVVAIGEDPDTGIPLPAEVMHVSNGQADTASGLMAASEQVSRRRGANAYFAPVLFRPDLPTGEEGEEADVLWQLAIVSDFDQGAEPGDATSAVTDPPRGRRDSPGSSQTWLFFDPPYPPDQVKPFHRALAAKTGDECKSLGHPVRLPGSLTWPNRREREKLRRSPAPVRAKLRHAHGALGEGHGLGPPQGRDAREVGTRGFHTANRRKNFQERMLRLCNV